MHMMLYTTGWRVGVGPWGQGGDVETCFLVSLGPKKSEREAGNCAHSLRPSHDFGPEDLCTTLRFDRGSNVKGNQQCILFCLLYICVWMLCTENQALVRDNALVNKPDSDSTVFSNDLLNRQPFPRTLKRILRSSPLSLRYRTGGAFKRGSGGAKTALNY